MMNAILCGMLIFSMIAAAFQGKMEALSTAALTGCGEAITLILSLAGMLCLWSGLMEIARRCRLTEALARLFAPFTRLLFPSVPQGSPAMQAICMNLSANLLGLGNAATPLGLAAMQELQKQYPEKECASDAMVTFVVLNTASIQLIPATVASVRSAAGCRTPFDILPAVWLASVLSVTAGLLMAQLLAAAGRWRR